MSRIAQLEIHKEELSFSAGHFTIFSATDRETLHGHNYYVSIAFEISIEQNGLSFDYRFYRKKMQELCDSLDRRFLLPMYSPYLTISEERDYYIAQFDQKNIPFLKEDVILLPIINTTIEELSHWFLQKILENADHIDQHAIQQITVKVYNGPGQSGGATWKRQKEE